MPYQIVVKPRNYGILTIKFICLFIFGALFAYYHYDLLLVSKAAQRVIKIEFESFFIR